MPHERNIEGRNYVRIEHGLSKREAQRIAKRERGKQHKRKVRVIKEGNTYSVFIRVRG